MPKLTPVAHANLRAGWFYSAADRDGTSWLCCPVSGCSWEKEITSEDDLDSQLALAENHVTEMKKLLTT